jgi:hypothetical protein
MWCEPAAGRRTCKQIARAATPEVIRYVRAITRTTRTGKTASRLVSTRQPAG